MRTTRLVETFESDETQTSLRSYETMMDEAVTDPIAANVFEYAEWLKCVESFRCHLLIICAKEKPKEGHCSNIAGHCVLNRDKQRHE